MRALWAVVLTIVVLWSVVAVFSAIIVVVVGYSGV